MSQKLALLLLISMQLGATMTVNLSSSLPSPQPLGTVIVMTPTVTDTNAGTFDYQFRVVAVGEPAVIVQEYDVASNFEWAPYTRERDFVVHVIARNMTTKQTATAFLPFTITPRAVASGGPPVITPTANPLVAFYSAPGCPLGSSLRVKFTSRTTSQRTPGVTCSPNYTANIYVAGLLASTEYQMNYEVFTNGTFTSGPILIFKTGAIPSNLRFPALSVAKPDALDLKQTVVLINTSSLPVPRNYIPFATDLHGNVIWYYPKVPPQNGNNMRPAPGGTILFVIAEPTNPGLGQQLFREIDLAGNNVRQTSTLRLSDQLIALGRYPIVGLNHDVLRLANGHTLLLASQEKMYPAGTQGSVGPVDILGNAIIELDTNLQIVWSWSAFDHLDVNRRAVLGETCLNGAVFGCPPLHLANIANDWTHGNSLSVATDGSLLFSCRHQDLVYKIDYASGTGTGDVLWKLGLGGDFTMVGTNNPYPWFSHQHNAEFAAGGTTLITVFDNGNTRVLAHPGEHSRGQALTIDQTAMTATLTLNADLGVFSHAVGSAQLLDNGNYHFASGWIIGPNNTVTAQSYEVTPAGQICYQLNDADLTYRTYRMSTLYSVP